MYGHLRWEARLLNVQDLGNNICRWENDRAILIDCKDSFECYANQVYVSCCGPAIDGHNGAYSQVNDTSLKMFVFDYIAPITSPE